MHGGALNDKPWIFIDPTVMNARRSTWIHTYPLADWPSELGTIQDTAWTYVYVCVCIYSKGKGYRRDLLLFLSLPFEGWTGQCMETWTRGVYVSNGWIKMMDRAFRG